MDIKNLHLFQTLSKDEIQRSLHCSRSEVITIKKGAYIFQQDEVPHHLYLILDGTVLIGQVNFMGKQMYAEYLGEGCCFGETDLFLQRQHYEYSSIAKTDVQLLAVSRHFFAGTCQHNCSHHGRVIFNMLHIFAEASERNATKIQLLTSGTLRQRTAYYLQRLSNGRKMIELPLNREEMAIYLNTTRPSLSRELSSLQDCGSIKLDGHKKVHFLDFSLLQEEIDGFE